MTTDSKIKLRETEIDPHFNVGCTDCGSKAVVLTVAEDDHHTEIVAAACQDHR